MRFFPALVSTIVIPLLAITPVTAQTAESPALEIRVLNQGLDQGVLDRVAVQITDSAGSPVPDATVVFRLPDGSTTFNGTGTAAVQTDTAGLAQMQGVHWGGPGGAVRITATKGTAHAGLMFEKPAAPSAPAAQHTPPAKPAEVPDVPAAAPHVSVEKTPPQPGILVEKDDSPNQNVPIRPLVAGAEAGPLSPKMSIISDGKSASDHHLRNRVLIGVAAVVAAAGATFALTHIDHSSSSGSSISVGPPVVSVGHP